MVQLPSRPLPPDDSGAEFLRQIRIDPGTTLANLPWIALCPRGTVLARSLVDVSDFGGLTLPLMLVPKDTPQRSAPAHSSARQDLEPRPVNIFRLCGDVWQLVFGGRTAYVKDRVGMGYLARLLAQPGREVPATVLFANRTGVGSPTQAPGDPLVDADAHAAYRRRYAELCDEESRAEREGDAARLAAAREEMQGLATELARAVGLGGRVRERSDADRLRKSVSMAIARDIDRISDRHPDLGDHLRRSVLSGFVLRYAPEGPTLWETEFFPTSPDATDFVALPQEL